MSGLTCCRFVIALLLLGGTLVAAETPAEPLLTINWDPLKKESPVTRGEVVPGDNGQPDRLRITKKTEGDEVFLLRQIEAPPIKTSSYAIRGIVRYENVAGAGFLEMWNHFPDEGEYFSRTLDISGPMGKITGSSPDRRFILPFHTLGKSAAPDKLTVNLVLRGPGTVEIGPLELIPIEAMTAMNGSDWWTNSAGGLIGGIGGCALGITGALIGVLAGLGKGKRFVIALAAMLITCGIVAVTVGTYAATAGQSFVVYYPLLLLGGMMTVSGSVVATVVPKRYRDHELRRMRALDTA